MDMEFPYIQKISMVKLLLDIICVDGKIDSRETFLFEKIKSSLNLNPKDHFKAHEFNTLLCLSVVKDMTSEQKAQYNNMLVDMILADEEVASNERTAYENICVFCGIKPSVL